MANISTATSFLHVPSVPGSLNQKGLEQFPNSHEVLDMEVTMTHLVSPGETGLHQGSGCLMMTGFNVILDEGPGFNGFFSHVTQGEEIPELDFVVSRHAGEANQVAIHIQLLKSVLIEAVSNVDYDPSQQKLKNDMLQNSSMFQDIRSLHAGGVTAGKIAIMPTQVIIKYWPTSLDTVADGSIIGGIDFKTNSPLEA